jgi:hypothetical protein
VFYPERQCALSETIVELRGSVLLYPNLLAAPSGLRNWLNWSLTTVLVDVWRRTCHAVLCGLPRKRSYSGGPKWKHCSQQYMLRLLVAMEILFIRVVSWIPVLANLWEVPVEGSHSSRGRNLVHRGNLTLHVRQFGLCTPCVLGLPLRSKRNASREHVV